MDDGYNWIKKEAILKFLLPKINVDLALRRRHQEMKNTVKRTGKEEGARSIEDQILKGKFRIAYDVLHARDFILNPNRDLVRVLNHDEKYDEDFRKKHSKFNVRRMILDYLETNRDWVPVSVFHERANEIPEGRAISRCRHKNILDKKEEIRIGRALYIENALSQLKKQGIIFVNWIDGTKYIKFNKYIKYAYNNETEEEKKARKKHEREYWKIQKQYEKSNPHNPPTYEHNIDVNDIDLNFLPTGD
jgi:hypothetical protein